MTHSTKEHGFSLLEVLIAMALASVLAVAAFTVFYNSQRATSRITRVIENRQNSRTAVQLLERDLRMAGSGWGQMNVEGCYNGSVISIPPVQVGYGGSEASNDTLGIIGAWDQSTSLSSAMATPQSNTNVKDVSGFADNDFFVVTNGQTAHLFQITSINTGALLLNHNNTNSYDMTGGHQNWPSGGYKAGSKVYRASWVSYQMDTLSSSRDKVVRWSQNSTRQVVAYNVQQFKVGYWMQSDTLTRNPDNITEIEQVRPVLLMLAKGVPNAPAILDSSWASVKPRSF